MTDREALLAAVLETPADDTARLVLADYLEENDEPEFGRLLRAGVTLARRPDGPEFDAALRDLAAACRSGLPAAWLSALGLGRSPVTLLDWVHDGRTKRPTVRVGGTAGEFDRGMLCGLTVTLDEWYAVAGRVLAAWPVERVRVRDVPGLAFYVEPPSDDHPWRLSAALTVQPQAPDDEEPGLLWNLLGVAAGLFGLPVGPGNPPPAPGEPQRWSGEFVYPDRPSLVAAAADSARLGGRQRAPGGDGGQVGDEL